MLKQNYLILFLFFNISGLNNPLKAQDVVVDKMPGSNYEYPELNLLTTHPLGLFISRLQSNFRVRPPLNTFLSFHISNGNVWLPFVKAYIPVDSDVRKIMEKIVWHGRVNNFFLSEMPSDSFQFAADAVIRVFRANASFRLSSKQELGITIRSLLLSKGEFPYSFLTNDKIIEAFHSNIAGGNDPFARKYYGYDKSYLKYTDVNGKSIELEQGDFLIPGIEANYYYYPPWFINNNIFMKAGAHLGVNLSKYNRSIDGGLSLTSIKIFSFSEKKSMHFGVGVGVLKQHLIKSGTNIKISDREYICNAEAQVEYYKLLKKNSYISFGLNYSIQSSYNIKNENKFYILTGNRISTHWHYSISHLYRPPEAWNLYFAYSRNYIISIYLKEDLNVNNAPDVQTGINFQIPIYDSKNRKSHF